MSNRFVYGEPYYKCLCKDGVCENIKGINSEDQKARDIFYKVRGLLDEYLSLDHNLIPEFTFSDILKIIEEFQLEIGDIYDLRFPSEPPNLL